MPCRPSLTASLNSRLKHMLPGMPSLRLMKVLQVTLDEDGFGLQPEMAGLLMAQHYIRFQTMIGMLQIGQGASMADLLWVIANSEELSEIVLRRSEKKVRQAVQCMVMEMPCSTLFFVKLQLCIG